MLAAVRHRTTAGQSARPLIPIYQLVNSFLPDRGRVSRAMRMTALAGSLAPLIGSSCQGDLDGSGAVDGADLGSLLAAWGQPGPADLDGSGAVDGADLGTLLAAWGACP